MQCHAQCLIYRYADNDSNLDWHAWPQSQVRNRILNTVPPELRNLYRRLLNPGQRGLSYDDERRLEPLMAWIDGQGPGLGYRVPVPIERARSTGRINYLTALRLNEVQLFNVVGNHFDSDALRARIKGPLRKITSTIEQRQHALPSPADLAVIFHSVAWEVTRLQIPVVASAFPPDLMRQLTATFDHTQAGADNDSLPNSGGYSMAAGSGHTSQ